MLGSDTGGHMQGKPYLLCYHSSSTQQAPFMYSLDVTVIYSTPYFLLRHIFAALIVSKKLNLTHPTLGTFLGGFSTHSHRAPALWLASREMETSIQMTTGH